MKNKKAKQLLKDDLKKYVAELGFSSEINTGPPAIGGSKPNKQGAKSGHNAHELFITRNLT